MKRVVMSCIRSGVGIAVPAMLLACSELMRRWTLRYCASDRLSYLTQGAAGTDLTANDTSWFTQQLSLSPRVPALQEGR